MLLSPAISPVSEIGNCGDIESGPLKGAIAMNAKFLRLLMLAASLGLSAIGCANPLNLDSFGSRGLPRQAEPDVVTQDSDEDIITDVGEESD